MLRIESKIRARALQLLYAWESGGGEDSVKDVALRAVKISDGRGKELEPAEELAAEVARQTTQLDAEIAAAADHWRLERVGAIERIILRIGLFELKQGHVPARVVIDESLRLAHWFAGSKAPAFVNGVLDQLARANDRL